jgi:hypothetical protein
MEMKYDLPLDEFNDDIISLIIDKCHMQIIFLFLFVSKKFKKIAMNNQKLRDNLCELVVQQSCQCLSHNYLGILSWALKNDCPWNVMSVFEAIKNGNLLLLKWAYNNNCYFHKSTSYHAASYGKLDILAWLRENKFPFNWGTLSAAIRKGHLDIVEWLHNNKFPWTEDIIESAINDAAGYGYLDMIKWLFEHNYPLNDSITYHAARGKQLELLKWLHEINCPADEDTLLVAITTGYLDMIKLVYDNGFPWSENTIKNATHEAITCGHLHVIKWLHKIKCLNFNYAQNIATQENQPKILKWIKNVCILNQSCDHKKKQHIHSTNSRTENSRTENSRTEDKYHIYCSNGDQENAMRKIWYPRKKTKKNIRYTRIQKRKF